MKVMYLIIVMFVMMSLVFCFVDGNDFVENLVLMYFLEKMYGVRSVIYEENNFDKLKLSELLVISFFEVDYILFVL